MDKFVGPAASAAEKYTPVANVDPLTGLPITSAGADSNGDALPANFESLPYASNTTWGSDGYPTQTVEVVTASGATYTKTTTYTANAPNPPNESATGWVKS